MARKKRSKPHQEEASEAWLLPYSDLLTLLLALFLCLFAMSQTDQTKVAQMAQAFTAAFNSGGPSFFDKAGPNMGRMADMPSDEDKGNSAYIQENQQLEGIKKTLDQYISQNHMQDELNTEMSAMTLNSMPQAIKASKAPPPAEGRVERMVSGWMRLS